jgi:transposase-like protein
LNTATGWDCPCPDHVYRDLKCKHIYAVEFSLKIREVVQPTVIEPIHIEVCLYCKSPEIVRDGQRHNKYGDIQKWNCKACGRYFTVNLGFERMKHNPQGITTAMQLYFSGESLRNTAKSLKLIGVEVSYRTILNWIRKYTELMETYLDKITPNVSDTWRADEFYLKVKGDTKYLYALMDDETRFWIAQEVAGTKFTADVRPLFRHGVQLAAKKPKVLITDGAANFHEAYVKELRTLRYTTTKHIRDIRLGDVPHNNKMERMNGEIRDREKVMRSLKKEDSPILTGYQLFHNYIRPHMALDGQTPAERAGIKVNGENKWLTIIQNASRQNGQKPSSDYDSEKRGA